MPETGTVADDYDAQIEAARLGEQDEEQGTDKYEFSVTSPSGATTPVLTSDEAAYYQQRSDRYMDQFKFNNVSDLQDLDRVLNLELILHRYSVWITLSQDYWGSPVSEKEYNSYIKDLSMELRQVKKSMGLDKATRDKLKGEQFVDYMENLRRRAKEFGVMREVQLSTALVLMQEVKALLQIHLNSDETERTELGLHEAQVIKKIWEDIIPRYDAVDEYFRKNVQRFWISEQ